MFMGRGGLHIMQRPVAIETDPSLLHEKHTQAQNKHSLGAHCCCCLHRMLLVRRTTLPTLQGQLPCPSPLLPLLLLLQDTVKPAAEVAAAGNRQHTDGHAALHT
jgi:hypothetical protein